MIRRNYGYVIYKEDEIWYIAAAVLSALNYLEEYQIHHEVNKNNYINNNYIIFMTFIGYLSRKHTFGYRREYKNNF